MSAAALVVLGAAVLVVAWWCPRGPWEQDSTGRCAVRWCSRASMAVVERERC